MSGFLLDTCVVSELVKPDPDPGLTEWIESADEDTLYLSVLTLGELRKGIESLPPGRKKERLSGWLERELAARFRGRILALDEKTCDLWGRSTARLQKSGLHAHVVDMLLAATAEAAGLRIVTRNVFDFEAAGIQVVNPWSA
jgi:predicted nucleic acid-binding protein